MDFTQSAIEQGAIELALGLVVGALGGILGIGGGAFLVPAMVLLLGVDQRVAQGVSLAVIVPTAVVGALTHYRHGYVLPRLAIGLGLAAVVGALAGSWLSELLYPILLRQAFGVLLVLIAVRMLVD